MLNGTELGAQEWRDSLFLRYGLDTLYLPKFCDRYNSTFYIFHAIDCKKGVLVTARHNEICDGVSYLSVRALTTTHVSGNPIIFAGRAMQR